MIGIEKKTEFEVELCTIDEIAKITKMYTLLLRFETLTVFQQVKDCMVVFQPFFPQREV